MKKTIFFVTLVVVVFLFIVGDVYSKDELGFSQDGKRIIFSDKSDKDIPQIKAGLIEKVPLDLKFMVGKVFRGQFYSPIRKIPGSTGYLILTDYEKEGDTIIFWMLGLKSRVSTLICPPERFKNFACYKINHEHANTYKITINKENFCLLASDGYEAEFSPIAIIPKQ